MHRGRPYPRHPEYWSTEGWFWPGFVPWKLTCKRTGEADMPWAMIPTDQLFVSEPGIHPARPVVIEYRFILVPGTPPVELIVFLRRHGEKPGPYKCLWTATLGGSEQVFSTAYAFQTYPQKVVALDGFDYSVPQDPYTSTAGPPLRCRPADYAQGGSPYDLVR